MDVSAASGGSPGIDPQALKILSEPLISAAVTPKPLPSGGSSSLHDRVMVSLPALTDPAIRDLLQVVEDRLFPAGAPQAGPADTPHYHVASGSYAHTAPTLAQTANGIVPDARETAIKAVANAEHAIEMAGGHVHRPHDAPDPRTVLALANQFIETGQLANYLRAAELGTIVAFWYDGPVPLPLRLATHLSVSTRSRRLGFGAIFSTAWGRAPLLILLAAWLVSGLVAALLLRVMNTPDYETSVALDVWAVGFLALIVFQFVATIRSGLLSKAAPNPAARHSDRTR